MSKKAKAKASRERLKKKRSAKDSMRQLYEGYRDSGKNTKSKRSRKKTSKVFHLSAISHPHGSCGNIGCIKCHKINFKPFLRKGKRYRMPHWMYLRDTYGGWPSYFIDSIIQNDKEK